MRSKLTRIMGVALALVLVFGLGAAFIPANTPGGPDTAEAGTLSWSNIGLPSTTGNVLVGNAEDLGPVAISPNFTADNTVWATVNEAGKAPVVYKSTNGGHTWTATTSTLGDGTYSAIALVPSPNYASDSTIFVAIQAPAIGGSGTGAVFRSTNGGSSFGQLGVVTLGAAEVITSMDVAPDYDGTGTIVVGCANIATATPPAALATCVQIWGSNAVLSWTGLTTSLGAAVDVVAVKYSPNYSLDSTILVVTGENPPQLRAIVGGTWDSGIATTSVGATGCTSGYCPYTAGVLAATDIVYADIALPSDYNGQVSTLRRAYVTIVDGGATGYLTAANCGNVYRITNVTAGTALNSSVALSNIEYNGTFGEGTFIGGYYAALGVASDVYRTTNPTQSVVNWYGVSGAANKPTGTAGATANTTAFVVMSPNYVTDSTVIVGTQGDDSAFGASTNGAASFNERGLIEGNDANLANIYDVALSPAYATDSTMFMLSNVASASGVDRQIWVTTNGGTYWDRCFVETWGSTGVLGMSQEFATDAVIYAADLGGTGIYYTANAGQSWSGRTCNVSIQTIAAPDATTVYVGESVGTGRVSKSTNSGWTWPTARRVATGAAGLIANLKVSDSTLVAGCGDGTVRRSNDGGTTWAKVASTLTAGNVYVDFDDTFVWAIETGSGDVYRSEDGDAWRQIASASMGVIVAAESTDSTTALELILAEDGTMYALEQTLVDVWRSVTPEAKLPTPNTTFQSMAHPNNAVATTAGIAMDVVSGSSNIIAAVDGTGTAASLRLFTDTLCKSTAGPTLSSPADKSTLSRGQATRFSIAAHITNVTSYHVVWSTDSTFTSAVNDVAAQTTDSIDAPGLQTNAVISITEGATVYWRARATAPFIGSWSEVWSFETQITTTVDAPATTYPGGLAGSTVDVPIDLVFNWGAFKYASGYEFQLANDSGMTDLLADMTGDSALGNVNSYKPESLLAYDSTYYWRVRAIKGTSTAYSDWSAVVGFTTESEPVAPTPPVIIEPTPTPVPVPVTTPSYIWAIISIGAVLVIVVIVLIVRTRRIA